MPGPLRLLVWNEFRQEKTDAPVKAVYPDGIHQVLAAPLARDTTLRVRAATLDEPEQGLSEKVLSDTDVLVWWGHRFHREVSDDAAARVCRRVEQGMGFLALHSSHFSKPFIQLMGASCRLGRWRNAGGREKIWVVEPAHPVAEGLPGSFELPQTEMYGEPFDVPAPDHLLFLSWYETGEVFRSGCAWNRGRGRAMYFAPGHETYPIFHDPNVQRVIRNAVRWLGNPYSGT